MPEITTWICDWCGEKYDDGGSDLPPTAKGWTLNLDPEAKILASTSTRVPNIYFFPKAMRMIAADGETKTHVEYILCPECITALQDAVKNVREVQISKRKAE